MQTHAHNMTMKYYKIAKRLKSDRELSSSSRVIKIRKISDKKRVTSICGLLFDDIENYYEEISLKVIKN